jgi:hypothetical protein
MRAILFAGALACMSCLPSERSAMPVLSTVDAVGKGVSQLLGWCEEHDVSLEDVQRAKKALDDKRYAEAAALAAELVEKIGEHEEVPEEIAMIAGLVKSLAEAHALD